MQEDASTTRANYVMLIQRNLLARAPFPLALRPSLSSFSTSRNLDNATSTMPLANLDTNRPLSSTNATAAAKDKQAAAKDRGACSTEPEQVAATQAFMALFDKEERNDLRIITKDGLALVGSTSCLAILRSRSS